METAAQEKLDALTGKLVDLGDRLLDAAEPAGRVAWGVTLHAIQFQAGLKLAFGAVAIIAFLMVLFIFRYAVMQIVVADRAWDQAVKAEDLVGRGVALRQMNAFAPVAVIFGLLTLLTFVVAAVSLLSPRVWLAVVSPEASIALRILNM